jgi:hypothetical protein
MKLKKSSGSKVAEASEEIADQLDTDESNAQMVAAIVGAVIAVGTLVFAVMSYVNRDGDW